MNTINNYIKRLSDSYYKGTPEVFDEVFDALVEKYNYKEVGTSAGNEIAHYQRMYSLSKSYPTDIKTWPEIVMTPKLDGAAISLLYVDTHLALGLTRGNGIKGRDITSKVKLIRNIPHTINRGGIVQITGEVVAPKTIQNARNYASGALNLENLEEFKTRILSFIAYDFGPYLAGDESWVVSLNAIGPFSTVLESDWADFPQDGMVCRVDNCKEYMKMGFTNHHPRAAFALKTNKEAVETTLLGIEWNVGRTGVVTPVGILEPIILGGATVSRATLHNIGFIRELNLEIGCKVEVVRSGEIIPAIVGRVDD